MQYFRKLFLLCITFLTINACRNTLSNPETTVIAFPDVNFENLIRETINKPSDQVTIKDVESISDLRGYGRNIKNIEGIEYLTGLTILFLSGNDITNISPLTNLTKLQELALTNNSVDDINPLANLTNLQYLGLQLNNITNISSLANLINLKLLKIGANNISDISPLVENQGIGPEDIMNLIGNPLNETSLYVYIPQLIARGVWVLYSGNSNIPACIDDKIGEILNEEVRNPPAQIWEWNEDEQTYYYITSDCCDQYNYLYDINCIEICAPDGGITGTGDGNCPDFVGDIERTLVWEDIRN